MTSRASRRAQRGSARSRRTPSKPSGGSFSDNIPWIPIAVVVGILVVVGGIIYLVIQAGQDANPSYEKEQLYEENENPDLPGEYVNLPEAFKDSAGNLAHYGQDSDEGPNTNSHVTRDVDYSKETSANSSTGLPPVGGPHWGQGGCGDDPSEAPQYCGPAPWGIYREPWEAATLVHNMEHSGVVVWYNFDETALRDELEGWVGDAANGGDRLVIMTPYDGIPENTVALTAWARRDVFPTSEMTEERVKDFINTMACRFNPENIPCS